MEIEKPTKNKIMKLLLKDFLTKHTITSLAREIGMSRVGTWKVLKKLQKENLIILKSVGKGKTSVYNISLNWDNPLLEKILSLSLMEDALKSLRWVNNLKELERKLDFLIIYGSIIRFPKEANDIDIIVVVNNKRRFIEIEKIIEKIQKTQIKKIHSLNFTEKEFKKELLNNNKAFIDAIKKGIILFGQERFIKFIKNLNLR